MMKRRLYILLQGILFLLCGTSCSSEQDESGSMVDDTMPVYRLRFDVGFHDYEGSESSTRAADGIWENGEKVYIRFHEEKDDVMGIGVYDSETDSWSIRPEKTLTRTDLSMCDVLYFLKPAGETAFRVSLTTESTIYADTNATYMLYDDLLIVTAVLSPKTGRIRFKGVDGQTFNVSGLSYYTEYVFEDDSYSSKPFSFSSVVAADGYSPFAYAYFTEDTDKTLIFDYTDNAVFKRTFPEATLREGESGYITIPTIEHYDGWTLVNRINGKSIDFPTLSVVTVDPVRSFSAEFTATITSDGNGLLTDAGFILSTESGATLDSGTRIPCGIKSTTLSINEKGLQPETKYYVRAYAINEKGVAMSEEVQFVTNEDPGGSGFDTGGFDKENDWDK